jgi:NAD-dependent deacetylase
MKSIVIFSGAGMSAESGISTFRDSGGLWEQYKIEEVATPEAWARNPEKVQTFYNMRRKQILEVAPNDAHMLIAQLESRYDIQVITQNIDDLHERAGSSKVLHLHGNIRYAKSSGPNQEKAYYPIEGWELNLSDLCPDGYPLRPHVVWFGESVPMMESAEDLISRADILIVIGTSLQVYPAAGLVNMAPTQCEKFIIDPGLNESSIPADFKLIKQNASSGLKTLIDETLM